MSELDLSAVLTAAGRGDQTAWRVLVAEYGRRVYGLLVQQCGDHDLAEELTQMTFVTLVEKLGNHDDAGSYREQGKFEPWLFRVATNKLRDEQRRRQRQARTIDLSPAASRHDQPDTAPAGEHAVHARPGTQTFGGNPADLAQHHEQLQRLQRLVQQLPEQDRQVLELRHTAGLSFAQIADTLEQPLGTVLARAHRATAKLRKQLDAP